MTENKTKRRLNRPLRVALIAATALVALSATAMAAVPAVRDAFFTTFTFTALDGNDVVVSTVQDDLPQVSVDETTNQVLLLAKDGSQMDITAQADSPEGYTDGKCRIIRDAEGTVTVTASGQDGQDIIYSFRGSGDAITFETTGPEDEFGVVVSSNGAYSATEDEDGNMVVTNPDGNLVDYLPSEPQP